MWINDCQRCDGYRKSVNAGLCGTLNGVSAVDCGDINACRHDEYPDKFIFFRYLPCSVLSETTVRQLVSSINYVKQRKDAFLSGSILPHCVR